MKMFTQYSGQPHTMGGKNWGRMIHLQAVKGVTFPNGTFCIFDVTFEYVVPAPMVDIQFEQLQW